MKQNKCLIKNNFKKWKTNYKIALNEKKVIAINQNEKQIKNGMKNTNNKTNSKKNEKDDFLQVRPFPVVEKLPSFTFLKTQSII